MLKYLINNESSKRRSPVSGEWSAQDLFNVLMIERESLVT